MSTELPQGTAIVVLGPGGLAVGQALRAALPGARLHGFAGRVDDADETFADTIGHLRRLFAGDTPIVGVCAAGILLRAVAPLLADKRTEPPVVAIAEDGSVAVPLLGGHRGANAIARAAAKALGGQPAITTAGDVRYGLALDDPPSGWRVANPAAAKVVTAALLAGQPVGLAVESGDAAWLADSRAPFVADAAPSVRVTHCRVVSSDDTLVLHPPVLALGVGCERDTPAEDLWALVERAFIATGLALDAVACVASLDLKSDEAAVHALAARLGVPARFFTAAALEAETPRLANPSEVVFKAVGCHGVAEGAALAAAGPGGRLLVAKTKDVRATCAVAIDPSGIDPLTVGRQRGRLAVVGIGPGTEAWRSPEATAVLAEAAHVVGYGLYLDLLGDLITGKTRHDRPLSAEEERARLALDLAGEGQSVALVCSGDAGIYALATLVFELLDREDRPAWNRLDIRVVPGISAVQAAAARLGAPLGHDFCTISLSDLLTPWPVIERRVRAAAEGDFVIAFYNPVSQRRRHQLESARDILLAHRPPDTPVALARNLGRDGEAVTVIRLADLRADHADMLTLVLVGSSDSRLTVRGHRQWLYTPRGYKVGEQT